MQAGGGQASPAGARSRRGSRAEAVCSGVDVFFFLFEILFAFAGLDSGKLSNSCDRSNGSRRGSYSTSSYPHQYFRSSGKSAGTGCVDISYSNGRCPSWTDGCFSYRGNFQTAHSQSAR